MLGGVLLGLVLLASSNSPLSGVLLQLFGWGAYLTPILFLIFGLIFWRKLNLPFIEIRVLLGLLIFWVSIMLLGGSVTESGGGVLGGNFADIFLPFLPSIGVILIALTFIIISFIVMFNASIENFLKLMAWLIRTLGMVLATIFNSLKSFLVLIIDVIKPLFKRESSPLLETIAVTNGFSESTLEVLPPPSEPTEVHHAVAPILSTTSSILKEETVTNLPMSDKVWQYPPLTLLSDSPLKDANRGDTNERATIIERTLDSFGIKAKVKEVNRGPAVTQYAIESSEGTKLARIVGLQNDLALALASPNGQVRIEAPIPGRALVGIEVPNFSPSLVTLKNILEQEPMRSNKSKLAVAVGLDVAGKPVIADIGRMPHVLVAGSTGSGKSVLINSFLTTILFRASPSEVKFILIDPKRVEFTSYNNIPHLLAPVVVEADKALSSLKWAVSEMERRYKLLEQARVRNIAGYNEMSGFQVMPYIIIIVDELADLIHLAPVEIEKTICRLAQMARAVGIHLVLATQRPSVDVLTGLIKANIPTRIAFNVTSQVDSRVIIDQGGAEKLLGRGDMLYVPPEASKPQRIQGVFVSDSEINSLVEFLRNSEIVPDFDEAVTSHKVPSEGRGLSGGEGGNDELFEEAKRLIQQYDKASSSLLQRRLSVGYARAARILDELEVAGIVSAANGSKPRNVLVRGDELSSQNEQPLIGNDEIG